MGERNLKNGNDIGLIYWKDLYYLNPIIEYTVRDINREGYYDDWRVYAKQMTTSQGLEDLQDIFHVRRELTRKELEFLKRLEEEDLAREKRALGKLLEQLASEPTFIRD